MVVLGFARWIESWAKPVTRAMSAIGAIALCVMMLWIVADVAMRFLFDRPILGSFEMVEYAMVAFVFMALAFAQFNKVHIMVPVLVERLSPRPRAAVDALTGIVTLVIAGIMTWGAVIQTGGMFNSHVTSSVLFIPKWPFQMITAIGLAAFFVATMVDVLDCLARAAGVAVAADTAGADAEELRTV